MKAKKKPSPAKHFNISVADDLKPELLRSAAQLTLDTGKRTTVSDVVRLAVEAYLKGR